MEVLVQWFSHHLAQFISPEGAVSHFYDPDTGASRRPSGSFFAEDIGCEGTADLYRGKYYSDSVYPAFYPADL